MKRAWALTREWALSRDTTVIALLSRDEYSAIVLVFGDTSRSTKLATARLTQPSLNVLQFVARLVKSIFTVIKEWKMDWQVRKLTAVAPKSVLDLESEK